jgi:hypothetical protein
VNTPANNPVQQTCPRCHVPLGRQDTLCWACRHVLKAPAVYDANTWLFLILKLLAVGAVIVVLLKYRAQLEATMQSTLRSLLKHRTR